MRFNIISVAFLSASVLLASGTSYAQTSQPQTYAAVRQALLDGKHVTATFNFTTCVNGTNFLNAGVAIQSFKIDDSSMNPHIVFSDMHTTVQPLGESADGTFTNEFMRYTVSPDGSQAIVKLQFYSAPSSATVASLKRTITCQLGTGAAFHW